MQKEYQSPLTTVQQYLNLYKENSLDDLYRLCTKPGILEFGFLKWNNSENYHWSQTWLGNNIFVQTVDFNFFDQIAPSLGLLTTEKALEEKLSHKEMNPMFFPERLQHKLELRHDRQGLWDQMNPNERKIWQASVDKVRSHNEVLLKQTPTFKNAFRLYLCDKKGSDWSLVFADRMQVHEALNTISLMPDFETLKLLEKEWEIMHQSTKENVELEIKEYEKRLPKM